MWLRCSYSYWLLAHLSLLRFFIHSLLLPFKLLLAPVVHPVPSFPPRPGFSVVLNQTQSPWLTSWFPPHSVFFFPLLSLTLPVSKRPFIKVYSVPRLVMEVEGSPRQLGVQQTPPFNSGTWNCTRAAFSSLALKNKTAKKDKNTTC